MYAYLTSWRAQVVVTEWYWDATCTVPPSQHLQHLCDSTLMQGMTYASEAYLVGQNDV